MTKKEYSYLPTVLYEMWLWRSRNTFIVSLIPVYLQLTERGHLRIIPLSSYALSPTTLPLLEIFWNSRCGIAFSAVVIFFWMLSLSWNLRSCKADIIFGNSHVSFGAKSGDWVGCSISVMELWARNCLAESAHWVGALSWWRIQSLGQSSDLSHCSFV
jgi:hypothetical protein